MQALRMFAKGLAALAAGLIAFALLLQAAYIVRDYWP